MIREAILRELKRQGMSRYALAKKQDAAHESTCLAFLYSGRNVSLETAEGLLQALKLEIVPAGELAWLRLLLKSAQSLTRTPAALAKVLRQIADECAKEAVNDAS